MNDTETEPTFEGWAILELMGHRKLAGWVAEVQIAGAGMLRVDVPAPMQCAECRDGTAAKPCPKCSVATQFYSPSSLYCLTPTTEKMARKAAESCQPTQVQRLEYQADDGEELVEDDDPVGYGVG
jgi:hypothetical protein